MTTDYVHPTEAQKYRAAVNDKVFPRNPVYYGMSHMYMYESDDIGLILFLMTYQTCDKKALSITPNYKVLNVMSLYYVSQKRNSDYYCAILCC